MPILPLASSIILILAMVGLLSNTLKKAVRRNVIVKSGEAKKPLWRCAKLTM